MPVQGGELTDIRSIAYVELYVGNPFQSAYFYATALGFTPIAVCGPRTNVADRESYLLQQGDMRLLLTGALSGDNPIAEETKMHSDTVKDVAFAVSDARATYDLALAHGARSLQEPEVLEDEFGSVIVATIGACNDTVHSFVENGAYRGSFLPGFMPVENAFPSRSAGLTAIDHIALCVEAGKLDSWIAFYENVLDFEQMGEEIHTATSHSAMHSKVVANRERTVIFPIVEPTTAAPQANSQVDEYLRSHHGAGAQHIAFRTSSIVETVDDLSRRGIGFLETPGTYYETLRERISSPDEEELETLKRLGILGDRDDGGLLLQIFTKPIETRPTLFLEIIERRGAAGFGAGNIQALFEAVEREQAQRGREAH